MFFGLFFGASVFGSLFLMDKYSGQEVTVEGEEYVVLKSDDIIAIIET